METTSRLSSRSFSEVGPSKPHKQTAVIQFFKHPYKSINLG